MVSLLKIGSIKSIGVVKDSESSFSTTAGLIFQSSDSEKSLGRDR
jgi:hypothetical protein